MNYHNIISPKKLIEVALPLDAINAAAAREKSIRHGHPSTLHLWWARRPLAAARAVIFSQLVNDPEDLWLCQNPGVEPNKQTRGHWTKSRARLFKIIEDLVTWENTTNEDVLEKAREEIRKSWREICELNSKHPQAEELFNPDKMPGLHDPFAGGGTIPLEAQRLGLEAYASDLNPVAVLINKAMIEIPPKFSGMPPVNPESRAKYPLGTKQWHGAEGLAEDVRYYGKWMRDEAEKRIGHLYPKVNITDEMAKARPDLVPYVGQKLTVIAWLWARTVKSPNPVYSTVDVPLVSSFLLNGKPGQKTFVSPEKLDQGYRFKVVVGEPDESVGQGTSFGRQQGFRCLLSDTPIDYEYIREEAKAGRMKQRLLASVVQVKGGRLFLSPDQESENLALSARPRWQPDLPIPTQALGFRVQLYGMSTFGELFTSRQLCTLSLLSDLVKEAKAQVIQNSTTDATELRSSEAYAIAVSTYLAFAMDKVAEGSSTICTWSPLPTKLHVVSTFGRQALPMTWDFAEANPFADSSGNFMRMAELTANSLERSAPVRCFAGNAIQQSARELSFTGRVVSTDPPYYDNIGYADLSDFFYVWLRSSLRESYPDLFTTISVPKAEELIATPFRHKSKEAAEAFFLEGMTDVMRRIASTSSPAFPITIYYAFKQSDTKESATSSTGWDTFLEAVNRAGLGVTGTWPMRTERSGGFRNKGQNALASSIILVCRPRDASASTVSRRQFLRDLNSQLPLALDAMTRESEGLASPVAPVDLSQAIIGPGMAIFSKYSAVLEADGTPMTVRTALQLINRFLAEDDFDADTQFCLHWFDGHGWDEGAFGEADVLARAKATSVSGLVESGVLRSGGGKVQLLRPIDFLAGWNPEKDSRIPIWEVLHQLIRALRSDGESGAGQLLSQPSVESRAEAARQLAYRLYTLCERKGWAEDARAYNELVTSWSAIESNSSIEPVLKQGELF